jgi:hypothetical protein
VSAIGGTLAKAGVTWTGEKLDATIAVAAKSARFMVGTSLVPG